MRAPVERELEEKQVSVRVNLARVYYVKREILRGLLNIRIGDLVM